MEIARGGLLRVHLIAKADRVFARREIVALALGALMKDIGKSRSPSAAGARNCEGDDRLGLSVARMIEPSLAERLDKCYV